MANKNNKVKPLPSIDFNQPIRSCLSTLSSCYELVTMLWSQAKHQVNQLQQELAALKSKLGTNSTNSPVRPPMIVLRIKPNNALSVKQIIKHYQLLKGIYE